jgi:hypothetical protein
MLKMMDQQIKSVRDEFIGALNEMSNRNDSNSSKNEKSSNHDLSVASNGHGDRNDRNQESGSYGALNESKRTERRNSDVNNKFYFGRSTSAQEAQEAHTTLFYKHAFTEKVKRKKLENAPQDIPCARCVTLIGNVFLKTFQDMIDGLTKSGAPKETINFDMLDKQAVQIKESIDRLRYMTSESSVNSPRINNIGMDYLKSITPNMKHYKSTVDPVTDYVDGVQSKPPSIVVALRHNLMDVSDSSTKDKHFNSVRNKFKRCGKEPKISDQKTSERKISERKTSERKTSQRKTNQIKSSERKTSEQKTSIRKKEGKTTYGKKRMVK